jgi:hypothetical protein
MFVRLRSPSDGTRYRDHRRDRRFSLRGRQNQEGHLQEGAKGRNHLAEPQGTKVASRGHQGELCHQQGEVTSARLA